MENVRFSIIEDEMRWENQNPNDADNQDDKRSISSESSGDAEVTDPIQISFQRNQSERSLWETDEVLNSLKLFPNADYLIKILDWGDFSNLVSGSNDVNVALLLSVWQNMSNNVFILLENFLADPNCCDSKGRTPLHLACASGNTIIAQILLDHAANPNQWDTDKKTTALHCAASSGNADCIRLLLKSNAKINVGIEKRSALHYAIESGSFDCVETLLEYGADPNTPQVFTETPLHTASTLGYKECVKLLLQYGADVRSKFGKRRLTALHLAAEDDYTECVRLLIEHGAEIDAKNANGQTPLHLACLSQCIETVEILIKYGADVNAIYKDGRTALHAAIVKQSRCFECVRVLLSAGADVNKADNYGYTPLHISALNEFSACAYTLIEHGADITARTLGGVSALTFIVRRTPEIIPKLIAKLDSSIKVNDHELGDVDCEIKLDFRLLAPHSNCGESELLLSFIEVGQKRILKHPLCETFLFLKWRRIRKFFLMSLLYHAIFVLLFTLYILEVYVKNCDHAEQCHANNYAPPLGYLVVIMNLLLLAKEIFQMCHGIGGYLRYWENWLQWTIIFGVFFCVTPETLSPSNLISVPKWQHHIAGIVIFLVWLELMMLVGRFPIFGLYVQMFTKVAVNFSKFLLAYCCLLVAFGLSFAVLFTYYPAFEYIPWVMLKTITMMSGELEFENIFYGDHEVLYPLTSHILFLSFVLLVTVILTNLLVGLAVSDIQGLQASAGLDRLTRQAELVSRLESLFFSPILRRAPPKLISLCQKSALLRTSRYKLQFVTRPNDPRDTRLPEELKINIYKLVAERRDRNQSLKRRKRWDNMSIFKQSLEDNENKVSMRPYTITNMRNRVISENPQIPMRSTNNIHSAEKRHNIEKSDQITTNFQLREFSLKLDKVNSHLTSKIDTLCDEISRIKLEFKKRNLKVAE